MRPHTANVMRPTKAHGPLGQTQGEPLLLIKDCPFDFEDLSGRELELARSTFAAATLKAECEGDPKKRILPTDYIQFGDRKLHVGFVNDKSQVGIGPQILICGEER